MDRLLAGAGGSLTITSYDAAGDPVDAGSGDGEVAVFDSAGVEVAGSPFTATHGATDSGEYSLDVPSDLVILDRYEARWALPDASTRRTWFELVGGFLFTIADVRSFDDAFADDTKYPAAKIRARRGAVEDRFTTAMRISPTLRGNRESLDGSGTDTILATLRELHELTACSISGTALAGEDLTGIAVYPWGKLVRPSGRLWTAGARNVSVAYTHGMSSPSASLVDAGLRYCRHLLSKRSFNDERMTGISTDAGGFFRVTVAGRDGFTGIPDVDAVLAEEGMALGAIG